MTMIALRAERRKIRNTFYRNQLNRGSKTRPMFPRPPFGEGIGVEEPVLSCPIDRRDLPTINGVGLTSQEMARVNGAQNRATAEYGRSCPEATQAEIEAVGRKAASDELRRALKDRPAAPPLKAEGEPAPRRLQVWKSSRVELVLRADGRFEVRLEGRALADYGSLGEAEDTCERVAGDLAPSPVEEPAKGVVNSDTLPRTRRQPTAEDVAWWAANSPTRHDGYWVVASAMPRGERMPARRPGAERGPMRRRPSDGTTGWDDADQLLHHVYAG